MTIDDRVSELLARTKQAKAMARSSYSAEYKRVLADIAVDYERLASCRTTVLDTRQHWPTRGGCWTAIDQLPTQSGVALVRLIGGGHD
jgi:hypothetical protein